jgi:uncharacterized protein
MIITSSQEDGKEDTMAKCELVTRLGTETIAAMKAKNKDRLTVLRMLQAAIKQVEIDTREDLDEESATKIIRAYAKKVKDSLQGARDAGRDEMVAAAEAETLIVAEFLPADLDEAILDGLVSEAIAEEGADSMKDMGRVMKAAMTKVAGRTEGGRVSAAVKRLLAG